MNLKALIATLVLGTSSLAFADNGYQQNYSPDVRDHRVEAPAPIAQPGYAQPGNAYWQRDHRYMRPVVLANDTHVMGRALIKVAPSTRGFTKLELRSAKGKTTIDKVVIELGNGRREVLSNGGTISGKQSLTIDLPGGSRWIKSVVLIGSSRGRASIDVLAV